MRAVYLVVSKVVSSELYPSSAVTVFHGLLGDRVWGGVPLFCKLFVFFW